ncbi:4-aminobutyrate aminotransferase [Methylobacterium sp. Leaf118]|uniref:4-aminobutyrate aminotransferase n=1 Tax=Methylobacterium sp. Leaf118 TaxID=2876562 RepID=UPI001E36D7D3|nr:4-aminobutyrate aminotransferase [Methylobacterium sp. Leaf118]
MTSTIAALRPVPALAVIAALCAAPGLVGSALAQTTVTRSESVPTGKSTRLVIVPNLKKDCSNGPMPEIKVTTAPKFGSLITKSGKLKTPAKFRCPNKDADVQAIFYQSNGGYTGPDAVTVEIKNSDGDIEKRDIRITVDAAKADDKAKEKKETTDL